MKYVKLTGLWAAALLIAVLVTVMRAIAWVFEKAVTFIDWASAKLADVGRICMDKAEGV